MPAKKYTKKVNPFFYSGIEIPDEFFCDRKAETDKIKDLILSGNNIVLKAPRRMGKSSLIHHVFRQNPFCRDCNVIYIDIYPTRTQEDFVSFFYKGVAQCTSIRNRAELDKLGKQLEETTFNTEINIPKILKVSKTSKYGTLRIENSLELIFDFLSRTKRPNVIAIDEFQQIQYYPDSTIEASLRTFIQRTHNTNFIFSGSSKHLLTLMFESPDKPFYRSCRPMTLGIIPMEVYAEFCRRQFESYGRHLERDVVELVYNVFSGNTFLMQQTMNGLFQSTESGMTAASGDARNVIETLIDERADDYRTFLRGLKADYEQVLLCVANETIAGDMLSKDTRKNYRLPASSSVSNILEFFQRDEIRVIEQISPHVFKLEDKLLELWAAKYIFGNLDSKFDHASELFQKETELRFKL